MLIAVDSGTDHDKTFLRSYTVRRTFWAQQLQHTVSLWCGVPLPQITPFSVSYCSSFCQETKQICYDSP